MSERDADAKQPAQEFPAGSWQAILFSKLQWLMFSRMLVASSLFGSAVFVQLKDPRPDSYSRLLYSLIATLYLFSFVYAYLLKRPHRINLTRFAYLQFFFDALFITPLIYATGGMESIFSFLYFLTIISASYLLFTPGAFFAATVSGLCYATLMGLLQARVIAAYDPMPSQPEDVSRMAFSVVINIFAFYLVAILSSYLAEQFRRTKEALLEEQINLRELEEFNRTIVENISAGIITLDHRGRLTFLNRAAQLLTGLSMERCWGTSIDQLFPNTLEALTTAAAAPSPLARPARLEKTFTSPDNTLLHLGLSSSPLRSREGREVGHILIIEDLTLLKQLEEKNLRDERLKAVGRLAAGIAHEIRNPLASISGSIQVLRDELSLESENRILMDIVVRETDRLNGLITDFLSYVRQAPTAKRKLDLQLVISEVLQTLRHHPRYVQALKLVTQFDHTFPVTADESQVRQVIWNLTLNAVEVMPEGGLLQISTFDVHPRTDTPRPMVAIVVADSGPGIPESIMDRIFDPFFSTKPAGTGLGLALVEKIVQAHDGSVRARRVPDGGTQFEVLLPALPQDAAPYAEEMTPHAG